MELVSYSVLFLLALNWIVFKLVLRETNPRARDRLRPWVKVGSSLLLVGVASLVLGVVVEAAAHGYVGTAAAVLALTVLVVRLLIGKWEGLSKP